MPIIRYRHHCRSVVRTPVRLHAFTRSSRVLTAFRDDGRQPAAASAHESGRLTGFHALVLYDMPGLDFTVADAQLRSPEPEFTAGFEARSSRASASALHHALAGWPAWPQYESTWAGRAYYRPGQPRSIPVPRTRSTMRPSWSRTTLSRALRHGLHCAMALSRRDLENGVTPLLAADTVPREAIPRRRLPAACTTTPAGTIHPART
jgi:hypothetical protein